VKVLVDVTIDIAQSYAVEFFLTGRTFAKVCFKFTQHCLYVTEIRERDLGIRIMKRDWVNVVGDSDSSLQTRLKRDRTDSTERIKYNLSRTTEVTH